MVVQKNWKNKFCQVWISKEQKKIIAAKRFYINEPFYVILDRVLGIKKGSGLGLGFLSGQFGEFTCLDSSNGVRRVKSCKKAKKKR